MSEEQRKTARRLCDDAIGRGQPLAWFEELYSIADGDAASIPWADLKPNPHLVDWHATSMFGFAGKQCLKIGCGLGDDCEYMQDHGGIVTGFDISKTAVRWCRSRFPQSCVDYSACDLFDTPRNWSRQFAFVLESYTLQVLPPDLRRQAIDRIADFVAADGILLVVCRARSSNEDVGKMPWPLTRAELDGFTSNGLELAQLDDFHDNETPAVHRFRALFTRR